MKNDPLLKLGDADRIAWAKAYPFDPPDHGYVFRDGQVEPITDESDISQDLEGRVPVIAVGSNRGPRQLERKFGTAATVPVTRIEIDEADVVYSASIAPYGSVPATLYPSPGTTVHLHVTWLDAPQLEIMHATEGLGAVGGYKYGRLGLPVRCEVTGQMDRPYMYLSARGIFWTGDSPVAFDAIRADHRRYPTLTQEEMIALMFGRLASHDALDDEILRVLKDASHRDSLLHALKDHASPIVLDAFTAEM